MKKIFIGIFIALAVLIIVWWYAASGLPPHANSPASDSYNEEIEDPATGLVVENVHAGDVISSPLKITGYVNGNGWGGFEGQVGTVSLQDSAGNELDIEPLTATTEWMTTTVRFEANLEYVTLDQYGKLIFRNENPSGEPSRDKTVTIPVRFDASASVSMVKAYFGNNKLDPKVTCEKVFPVDRIVEKTSAVGKVALEELLKGPKQIEKGKGYETSINPGVQINSLTITGGIARVDFNDALTAGVAGSCRVGMIRLQIKQTLKQFPSVKSVVISVNGRTEDILQP